MSTDPRALRVDVSVDGGRHAAERLQVELTLPPGITCVVGSSGAGKSTLLGSIAGLVQPTRGRIQVGDAVWFDSARRLDVPAHRRRVAFVFQRLALFPHLTALGNVEFALTRYPPAERRERALALLHRVGVGGLAAARPRTLSGGEAQRVAIARALAVDPAVMLLDEPFSALDPSLRAQLTALVRDLVSELGVPTLHVTHNPDEVRALAQHAVHITGGKVATAGAPDDVLAAWLSASAPTPTPR